MSGEPLFRACEESILKTAWIHMACTAMYWENSHCGDFVIKLLIDHWGRDSAETVALYWNQHGRDDIAARIKAIIHQGEKP